MNRAGRSTLLLVAMAWALAMTGCGGSSSGGGDVPFAEALTVLPAEAELYLTDWSAVKSAGGDADTWSQDAQFQLLRDLAESGSRPVASYEVMYDPQHKDQWGWDLGDLDWEAAFVRGDGSPVYVLGLSDTVDVADVDSRLQERGFQARDVEGATLYEHEQDRDAEWFIGTGGSSAMSMFNMAVLPDENVIMTASDPAEIEAALAGPRAPDDEELTATLSALGDPAMGVVAPGGPQLCEQVMQLPGGATPKIEQLLEPYRGNPYETFGYGHDVTGEEPSGRIVLRYEDASAAEADLEVRRAAAEEGPAPSGPAFSVEEISVDGQHIVMELGPNDDGELRVGEAYVRGDLLVAAC